MLKGNSTIKKFLLTEKGILKVKYFCSKGKWKSKHFYERHYIKFPLY